MVGGTSHIRMVGIVLMIAIVLLPIATAIYLRRPAFRGA